MHYHLKNTATHTFQAGLLQALRRSCLFYFNYRCRITMSYRKEDYNCRIIDIAKIKEKSKELVDRKCFVCYNIHVINLTFM